MEKKEAYKVVKMNMEGYMVSCYAPDDLEIVYKLGERAVPKIGKIFCFKTYRNAINWRVIDSNMSLLLCEAEGVTEMEFHIPNGGRDEKFAKIYRSFWRSPKRWATFLTARVHRGHYPVPTGTVFCKAITPLKIINMRREYK